ASRRVVPGYRRPDGPMLTDPIVSGAASARRSTPPADVSRPFARYHMTDLEALRRAILDHPDDDTARLVYADALEDVGESARAAFVRSQVELARLPDYDPFAVRCRTHHRDVVTGGLWALELPALPDGLDW